MVVAIMKGYTIFVIILMLLYTARHFYFTIVRLLGRLQCCNLWGGNVKNLEGSQL